MAETFSLGSVRAPTICWAVSCTTPSSGRLSVGLSQVARSDALSVVSTAPRSRVWTVCTTVKVLGPAAVQRARTIGVS